MITTIALFYPGDKPGVDAGTGFSLRLRDALGASGVNAELCRDNVTLQRYIESGDVSVVHVIYPSPVVRSYREALRIVERSSVGMVTTVFGSGIRSYGTSAVMDMQHVLAMSKRVIVTNHELLRLLRWLPGSRSKTLVAGYVGSNLDGVGTRRFVNGGQTVVYFGHIDRSKGVEYLVEAMKAQELSNVALEIVDGTGEELKSYGGYVAKLIDDCGLHGRVRWTRAADDATCVDRLCTAGVCVFPFVQNSVGRSSLAAALALGCPTICAGGRLEASALGESVYLVPRRDPAALARAIREVLTSASLRSRLSREGRALYESKMAWDVQARSAIEAYRVGIK